MLKAWIKAFRLRTLPLGIASIAMGSILALGDQAFSWSIFGLALLTTVLLQILSNVANDYGDSINGADNEYRQGPLRQTQLQTISKRNMKQAMMILIVLSLLSGISLLFISGIPLRSIILFLVLGLIAIYAAISYTAGENPYGYVGLGDISVLVFFGWLGILGSYYLYTGTFQWTYLLPATTCGLFMVAVLNINNIRDIFSDEKAGKYSIPVRLGRRKAVWYHWGLLGVGFSLAVAFMIIHYKHQVQFLIFLTVPLLLFNGKSVLQKTEPKQLDPYLKQMVLTTIVFVITFGIGHYLANV